MNTQKLATKYRMSQWAEVLQKKLDSGQSVKDFCQTMGISRNAYFYWQQKLRKEACTKLATPNGWVQLATVKSPNAQHSLTIEISGCHINANSETDMELLAKVCRALRSL